MQFKQLAKGFIGVMLLTALTGCGSSGNTSDSSKDTSKEKLVVQFVPTAAWKPKQNLLQTIYRKN